MERYYLRARYYEPATGRFITEDSTRALMRKLPNGIEVADPLSLNLYTYAHNNPVLYYGRSDNSATLVMDSFLSLSGFLPWLVGGIATGMVSIKTAIATYWMPIVATSAAIVGAIAVGYVIHEAISYSIEASKATAWAYAQVATGGLSKSNLSRHSIYFIIDNNTSKVVYVGRTSDFGGREYAHQKAKNARFPGSDFTMMPVRTGLSYEEARVWEQALITGFTLEALYNMINSISPSKWEQFKYEFQRVESLIS